MVCGKLKGRSYVIGDLDEPTQVIQGRRYRQLNKSIDQ